MPALPAAKKRKFLAAFALSLSPTKAAEAIGITRQTHYEWLHNDPHYKAAFDEILQKQTDFQWQLAQDNLTSALLDGYWPATRFVLSRAADAQNADTAAAHLAEAFSKFLPPKE